MARVIIWGSQDWLIYAERLQQQLNARFHERGMDYHCVLWNERIWRNGAGTMQSLIENITELKNEGFAIAMFTPDDELTLRQASQYCSRDNVWLEYGLCVGMMGATRVFPVFPKNPIEMQGNAKNWRTPTDFQLYHLDYLFQDNDRLDTREGTTLFNAQFGNIADEIATAIANEFPRRENDPDAGRNQLGQAGFNPRY